MNRRNFLTTIAIAGASTAFGSNLQAAIEVEPAAAYLAGGETVASEVLPAGAASPVDFRYSPLSYQTVFCFPDDPHKSIVGEKGDLRYGFDPKSPITYMPPLANFPITVEFSLQGMNTDKIVSQQLESPGVPIIHTVMERAGVRMELVTFATSRTGEGRVDNVLMSVSPLFDGTTRVGPVVRIVSRDRYTRKTLERAPVTPCSLGGELDATDICGQPVLVYTDAGDKPLFMVANLLSAEDFGAQQGLEQQNTFLAFHMKPASAEKPFRCLFRFPQEGQGYESLAAGTADPENLLAETRAYWSAWRPFKDPVGWQLQGRHDEFLTACARNILQARELKDGHLTFQVGPTVYRGLWVVDGHFLLEAARYLGYDKEAEQGLRTTWSRQQEDGMILAGGGNHHWKDTAIAIFSLIRQAELSQDWSLFDALKPNVLKAVAFLADIRQRGLSAKDSPNGSYGLLVEGFADGGLAFGSEITNSLWTLTGLNALVQTVQQRKLGGYDGAIALHRELSAAMAKCVASEMRQAPQGFSYLPMLLKGDKQWSHPDEWERPRPQAAQWALSHTIYPGLVFPPDHPVVRGHAALMQTCAREDIPAETGWNPHEAVWTYNAPFVAEVYLWMGQREWAARTFAGFLNHASPLYCWREEQPLRGGLSGTYVGDMPHNWASAECVRYLRHMFALEDGSTLRLLAGVGASELANGRPMSISGSPTRFGRVSLNLEPLDRSTGWLLRFKREPGPTPAMVMLPSALGGFHAKRIEGAKMEPAKGGLAISSAQQKWTIYWEG